LPKTPKRRPHGGLTLDEVVRIASHEIPSDLIGDVLRRLPARFYSQELELFRPLAPAVMVALAAVDEIEDDVVADLVEVVALDPAPELPAWVMTPDGERLQISMILQAVARRVAKLYS
jgi:hypothetical protein